MQHQNIKKFIVLFMSLILTLCFTISPFAAHVPSDEEIMPLWESIHYMEVNTNFSGGKYNAVGSASKQSTATSIEGTLTIYQEINGEWVYLAEWSKSVTRGTLAVSGSVDATTGSNYKAVFEVTAYTGNSPEYDVMEEIDYCS